MKDKIITSSTFILIYFIERKAKLLNCIRKAFGSNLDQDSGYPGYFLQILQENARILP
jgi:hypothetical protein